MTWLAAAGAAVACWKYLPGTGIDRAVFQTVARGFANPPFFISGNGSHATPWQLRTFSAAGKADSRNAPVIVSLGDDVEGFFQSSPPSPVDLAVVLTNFQRLGAKKAATAAVLAWDAPDPIGLVALDKAISRFDSFVMTAPLSRGSVPETMPQAFRRASISIDTVRGDTSSLPVVNRVPLPGVILGKDNTWAGFQTLESERTAEFAPLLARWEDRLVFAFPLLTALQQLGLPLEGVEIRPDEFIKLSPQGPTVPIDRYGRLAVPVRKDSPRVSIPAEALIDGGADLFPKNASGTVLLRDDRSAAEPGTRAFSKQVPALIAAIAADAGLTGTDVFPRAQPRTELILLGLTALVAVLACRLTEFSRNVALLSLAAVIMTAQVIAAAAGLWLPGIPALAAVGCVAALSHLFKSGTPPNQLARPEPVREEPKPAPEPVAEKTPPPPGKKQPPEKATPEGKKRDS